MLPRNQAPMRRPFRHPGYYGPMSGRPPGDWMMMGRPPQMRQRGGMLAKLFGNGKQNNASRGFGGFGARNTLQGGQLLKSLTNPSSINGFLANTQKVLNTAQQVGPIVQQIQQYGPIIKNLPAMWKLYRGLKSTSDQKESKSETTINDQTEESPPQPPPSSKEVKPEETQTQTRKAPSPSIPKLYI